MSLRSQGRSLTASRKVESGEPQSRAHYHVLHWPSPCRGRGEGGPRWAACGSRQSTASPGQGSLQVTRWPLVSTVTPRASRTPGPADCGQPGAGSRCPRSRGSFLPSFQPGSCPDPRSPGAGASPPGALRPDAPSLRRPSWAMAPRTCTSSATAWARTRPLRRAGGWGGRVGRIDHCKIMHE